MALRFRLGPRVPKLSAAGFPTSEMTRIGIRHWFPGYASISGIGIARVAGADSSGYILEYWIFFDRTSTIWRIQRGTKRYRRIWAKGKLWREEAHPCRSLD